jgi:Domain of unknown function (DUF4126)
VEHALLTGLGLAAPAGLNAYLPLLILALADRFSSAVTLDTPYDFLSTNWGIAIIALLLTVEIVVDKVPGLDHANDLVQSAIRPAAGGILAMAATSDVGSINPVLAMILGLVAAGSVHAAKATTRPAITVATGGIGNPLVSVGEDVVAALSAIVAIFAPLLVLLVLVLFALVFLWAFRRLRRLRGARLPSAVSTTLRR